MNAPHGSPMLMNPMPSNLLAYSSADQREIFFYLGLIIAAIFVVVIVALIVRKLTLRSAIDHDPFTLHDLRRMHEDGELSDEEFEAARRLIVARNKQQFDIGDPPPSEAELPPKNFPDESDKDPDDDPPVGFGV